MSIVDLRIDFTALPEHVTGPDAPPVDLPHRLNPADLHRYLTAAWLAASQSLPLAATPHPEAATPAGPSRVEVHLGTERPWASPPGGRVVGLLDMLDLADWGSPPEQLSPWMSATVTTPLDLTVAEVDDLVEHTLRYLASGFGFLGPDD